MGFKNTLFESSNPICNVHFTLFFFDKCHTSFHMNWMSYKCLCVICVCYCSHCCHHNFYYFNEVHWTCRGISMNSKWPFVTKRIKQKQKYVCVLSHIFNGFSLFFQCIEMNVNEPIDDAHAIVLNNISKYYSPETLNFYITT